MLVARLPIGALAVVATLAVPPLLHADPIVQSPPTSEGIITPLSRARFVQDADVKCLKSALFNGNPDAGPSAFILKAPAGCRVPAHFHTAEEQMIIVRGKVWTAMQGMKGATLTAGGVALMPGKAIHWFSCSGKSPCLMVVNFDRKYDIVWAAAKGSLRPPSAQ